MLYEERLYEPIEIKPIFFVEIFVDISLIAI